MTKRQPVDDGPIEQQVIKLYEEYLHLYKVAATLGIHRRRVVRILKKNNIEISRSRSGTKNQLIDRAFLDNINESWKAYFLGFIYADGCIMGNKIFLGITDGEILEKINKKIFVDTPIKIRIPNPEYQSFINGRLVGQRKPVFCLNITNEYVANSARKIGLHERKSLTISFPEIFKNSPFLGDFIRGYFDGDGCISHFRSKPNLSYYSNNISIAVSQSFGESLKEILSKFNITSYLHATQSKIYTLRINSLKSVYNFYYLIYGGKSDFYLERKKKIFDNFILSYQEKLIKNKYAGLSLRPNLKWQASCKHRQEMIYIGVYDTKEEAYAARQEYIKNNNLIRNYGAT